MLDALVAWDRQRASYAIALPADAALDHEQRNRIHKLAVTCGTLGQILMVQNKPECVAAFEEGIRYSQRVQDTVGEAVPRANLGHAYKDIPAIRNLDAAEAAYQQSLDLWATNDLVNRSKTLQQIGMVHQERFRESHKRGEPAETVLKHAQAAEQHYGEALALCPPTAVADLGPMHAQTATLYSEVGAFDGAREHFEKAAQYFERANDHYNAGKVRRDIARMYLRAADREATLSRQRDLLHRAQAYAQAALRDFQHPQYQGRLAADEARSQQLLAAIAQALAKLPA